MDSTRRIIILLIVGVVMIFGIIALRSFTASDEHVVAEERPTRVLIATRDIAQGSLIQPGADLTWQEIPKEEMQETYLQEGAIRVDEFSGAIVRRQLRAGEPIIRSALTRSGEGGFMSAVLEPGMRAVSIAVSPTSGNAGFISPGDRVDLIVTHRVRSQNGTAMEGSVVSETFVRDVRVIAVDQFLENPENKAILAKTVTVEVTPRQAEQVAVATDLGKIALALRSVANGNGHAQQAPAPAEPVVIAPTDEEGETISDLYYNTSQQTPAEPRAHEYTRDSDVSRALDTGGLSSTIRVIRGDQVESVSLQ